MQWLTAVAARIEATGQNESESLLSSAVDFTLIATELLLGLRVLGI